MLVGYWLAALKIQVASLWGDHDELVSANPSGDGVPLLRRFRGGSAVRVLRQMQIGPDQGDGGLLFTEILGELGFDAGARDHVR